ncbi:hypothetical protein, partial [Pseudomonas batumici]|uniref:hypothetical protein n=1 Tax=Pseudomonas batumici TaxID=226910 RepID=UPI001AE0B427
ARIDTALQVTHEVEGVGMDGSGGGHGNEPQVTEESIMNAAPHFEKTSAAPAFTPFKGLRVVKAP